MNSGEPWQLGHRPALDGVRGIAILLVVACHARTPGFLAGGGVGVTVFFVLSGFLITALLLQERTTTGRTSFAGFYRRRALRLLPALVVVIAVMAALGVTTLGPDALLYFANWTLIGRNNGGGTDALAHTWSLSIEEQFYIVWPLLLVALTRLPRRVLAGVIGLAVLASMLWTVTLWDTLAGAYRIYYGTDTRASALLLGCLVAVLMTGRRAPRVRGGVGLTVVLVAGFVALGFATGVGHFIAAPLLASVGAAVLIWVAASDSAPAWLSSRWLVECGRKSYGLYLWHWPVSLWVFAQDWPWWAQVVAMLTASAALTELSWRLVESPFLALKSGHRRRPDIQVPERHIGRVAVQREPP